MTPTTGQPTEPAIPDQAPMGTGQSAQPTTSAQPTQRRTSTSASAARGAPHRPSPATPAKSRGANRRRTWPWALGSTLATLAILLATFAGHYALAHKRQAAQVVAAQTLPPLTVAAVAHPQAGAALFAVDPTAHHLVALTYPTEVVCPPTGACPAEPARNEFVTLDDTTGAQLVAWPLTGAAAHAAHAKLLLLDAQRHRAYAIAPAQSGQPGYVDIFSSLTGAYIGGYPLLANLTGATLSGVFDSGGGATTNGRLILLAGVALVSLDAATGRVLARQTLPGQPGAFATEGPVVDAAARRLYLLLRPSQPTDSPTLTAYSADTLLPLGALYTLPIGARLGPLDPTAHALYLFAADGAVSRLALPSLPIIGGAAPSQAMPALQGALALGWDAARRRTILADTQSARMLDSTSGQPIAALPLPAMWPAAVAISVDATRGLVYLAADHGAIVIAQESSGAQNGSSGFAPNAATALILARAALARLLPDTGQTPAFVGATTFPLDTTPGARDNDYWIHFSDLGWRGPYPGHASVTVAADLANPGAYTVTFSIDWVQLFTRSHTWTCEVTSTGDVQLTDETGDAVP